MALLETITRVFTKYDTIPERITKACWIGDSADILCEYTTIPPRESLKSIPYCRYAIVPGLEDVLFVHYMKEDIGGFIGEMVGETTLINCKATG